MKRANLTRVYILFLMTLCFSFTAFAENVNIKGVVKDASGETMIGVSVTVKGTTTGTITDLDGNYAISVPSDGTLVFNMMSYIAQAIPVKGRTEINVTLNEDSKLLDQVVVVGYGTSRRSDLTGAVASVDKDKMLAVPTTNVGEMLRGQVAGVQVSQSSSRPGGSSDIIIRGKRSLNANNGPLFIVDGVPADNIDDINANDIKAMEVLKDASSQAIYGARASAGVILVTTTRGESGKTKIDFSTNFASQSLKKNFDLFSPEEWIGMLLAQKGIYGGVKNATEGQITGAIEDITLIDNYLAGKSTNWYDELIRPAFLQTYNLAIRGGTDNTKVMTSLNYFQQDGMVSNTGYKRGTIRLNLDQKISKTVSMGTNISYNRSEQMLEDGVDGGSTTSGGSTLIQQALTLSPYALPYDEQGNLLRFVNANKDYNPIWNTREASDKRIRNNLNMTVFADWNILKDLKYRLNANYTYRDDKRKSYESSQHQQGSKVGGWGQFKFNTDEEWLVENIFTYDKKINKDQKIDFTFVQSADGRRIETFTQSAQNFLTDYFGANGIESANVINKPSRSIELRQIASFMGRVRYNLYDRYLFTASLRADGSSVFGLENKWGYFPSAALAWRVTQEEFMQNVNYLSNLKLRLSYGEVGNQGLGAYQTTANTDGSQMQFGNNGGFVQGLLPSSVMYNPYLKWESTASTNLGIDFGFLKDRITGSIEYYNTDTKDVLVKRTLAAVTGYEKQWINMGKISNKGIEVQLGTTIMAKKDLNWSVNAMYSRNTNKIVDMNSGRSDPANNWYIGQPMDVYLDYRFDGIFNNIEEARNSAQGHDKSGNPLPEDKLKELVGRIRVKDLNGDNIINEADRGFYDKTPRWMGSISSTIAYKDFDLLVDVFTSQGATLRNSFLYDYNQGGTYSGKLNGIKRDYWTPDGQGQEAPRPTLNATDTYIRTLGYQDASYIRIRTIQLGYNVPSALLKKMNIAKLRVFGTLTDFFTWTDFQSFSPEAGISSYPEPKKATLGINLSF